jgi:hypothetical protein
LIETHPTPLILKVAKLAPDGALPLEDPLRDLLNTEEMQRIETTALLICQITALLPGVGPQIVVSGRQFPTILLVADLISDDWEIVEDEATST